MNGLPLLGSSFPKNYYDLIEAIAAYRNSGKEEISRTEFNTLASKYRIPEKDQDAALGYLHKTGEVIYFDKEGLKEKVYINPLALTKRLYKLIEGNDVLEKERGEFDTVYAERVFASADWRELLELLESFGLVFRKPGGKGLYVAPQYLPDLSDSDKVNKPERKLFEGHQSGLECRFALYYPSILPENVMVNLLCYFGPSAVDSLYRNAIYFKLPNHSDGCVICTDAENRLVEVFTKTNPEGDSLARGVFEKFRELSKKTEIHVAVEKDKWVKASNLEDNNKENFYPTADGAGVVKAEIFHFLTRDRHLHREPSQPIDIMTPEELKKTVRNHIALAQTNDAIRVFKTWAETQGPESLLDGLIALESEWNTLQANNRRGVISPADEGLKTNQIVSRLLGYLGGVGENTGGSRSGPNGGRGEIGLDPPKGLPISTAINTPGPTPGPAKVFLSYARELFDDAERLKKYLAVQEENRNIEFWYDQKIQPGDNWDEAIKDKIMGADIFILLLSIDFWASKYIRTEELPLIAQRHAEGAKVLCVMVSDNDFESTAWSKLQAAPRENGRLKPVRDWEREDKAWKIVAEDLKTMLG